MVTQDGHGAGVVGPRALGGAMLSRHGERGVLGRF